MASAIDLIIIFAYLIGILIFSYFIGKKQTLEGFFVNNRGTRLWLLTFATISSSVGAGTVIGTAAVTYESGIGVGILFAIGTLLGSLVVGLLAPKIKKFGDKHKAHTLGDFFAHRYSKETATLVALIISISVFFAMSVQFLAVSSMLTVITDLNLLTSLIIAGLVTILYVSFAGIKGDFYTDAVQFWLILLLFILLVPLSLNEMGGITSLSTLPESYFNLFTYGGPLFFFGGLLFGVPLALVSMDVWQRIYSATDQKTARKAYYIAAFSLPVFYLLSTLLGLMAAVLVPGIDSDESLFTLMKETLPVGLLGIGAAGLLAVNMSTLDSQLVMLSATITKDFYKRLLNPKVSQQTMLKIGRTSSLLIGFLALMVAYLVQNIVQLIIVSITVILIFSPALIGGFFWKRANARAAFLSILLGFITVAIAIPFLKQNAFLPGVALSIVTFVFVSYLKKNAIEK